MRIANRFGTVAICILGVISVIGQAPAEPWLVGWGSSSGGQLNTPAGLNAAATLDGGLHHTLVLRSNGTVLAWGDNTHGQTNIPPGLSNVVAISAAWLQNVALKSDGTVAQWGVYQASGGLRNLSAGSLPSFTNGTAVAAGIAHALAAKADGSVATWGLNIPALLQVPGNLTGVKAVGAGWMHSVALKSNGTVIAWGYGHFGITNVPVGLTNVTAIAVGGYHTLALRSDGTVVAWGAGERGESGLWDLQQSTVPATLSNVVAISAGGFNSIALQSDGTVVSWGQLGNAPFGLDGVAAIGGGDGGLIAFRTGTQTPLLSLAPTNRCCFLGSNVTFLAAGMAPDQFEYQWQFNGSAIVGATNPSLSLTNIQNINEGGYRVLLSNGAGSITSPPASLFLPHQPVVISPLPAANLTVPYGSNVALSVQTLNTDGCPFTESHTWTFRGEYAGSGPTCTVSSASALAEGLYVDAITNAAGGTKVAFQLSVIGEGSPVWWGGLLPAEWERFAGLHDTIALAGSFHHNLLLRENGTVLAWGDNQWGATNVPAGLTDVVAIAAGDDHSLGLRADGTVVAWGRNNYGQCSVPNVSNITAIAACGNQGVALLGNGRVTNWGNTFGSIPADLTNASSVAAGSNFCLALRSNGTVVGWGDGTLGQTSIPGGLAHVVAIAASASHALALKDDGMVTGWGSNSSGESSPPGDLTNAMAIAAGRAHSVALRTDGRMVVWGDNSAGQANVPSWLTPAKLIAAGGDETLGSRFFPVTQYPVDVAKDLLLIYNTNSGDSLNVVSYYLAHRPRVAGANVLGIGSPTNEAIDLATFTNQIFPQVSAWLSSNPTKHPGYISLFPAIPSRIWTSTNCNDCFYESMSFGLSTNFQGIQPFVTTINMGLFDLTNDCLAYIDKLERFGTNFSPGNLLISASTSGYGNTNYFFDDVLVSGTALGPGNDGRSGVLITNPSAMVTYTNGTDYGTNLAIHVTRGTNLAGYLCRGAHSALNNSYALNGAVQWHGANSWWIIETTEAFNGWRATGQGNFTQWFSQGAFGGTNWSGTPVAAVTHTDGPGLRFVNDARDYFGLWESGRPFAICAWVSRRTPYFQAVGDPFVRK